ncbi:MAG: winged helix-turn-helix domain-containing protein [Campylobacterota bacterium]|nr:winged helix-turn-helix domain-containing protein [Campylobacterota bacterium]
MRLLTYNADTNIVEKLESDNLYITDKTIELDDALYHLEVRFYNLVLIYEDDLNNCIDLLNVTENKDTAFIIISENVTKKFEISCLKHGALFVLQRDIYDDLLMAKLESIHRDNFSKVFSYKDYFMIDNEYKEILDTSNNELNIKGKACDILSYLVQNRYRQPISKEEMLYTLWEEPELICQNAIEVNINQIRTKLKKRFGISMIDTIRNRGYKIVD